jgi:hypothetical protein
MFGYSQDPLLEIDKGLLKNIYAGHVGIYVGQENGEDYIVEAMGGGIVKTPAKYFVNSADQEVLLGAKIPRAASQLQIAKVVAWAKSLVGKNLAYDFDFKKQKGPGSGEWTCVGLAEKLYESADAINPQDLADLEYDSGHYAVNITPDGFDNYSVANSSGDCFSTQHEFSKIARRANLIVPAPELVGYDVGLEYNGERYIFLPYTQFLQPSLNSVPDDINLVSSFSDDSVRGSLNFTSLALRWSLINNPLSTVNNIISGLKNLATTALTKTVELAKNISAKLFNSSSDSSVVLADSNLKTSAASKSSSSSAKTAKSKKATTAKTSTVSAAGDLPTIIVNKASTSLAVSSADSSANTKVSSVAASKTTAAKTSQTKASSTKTSNKTSSNTTSYYAPAVSSASVSSSGGATAISSATDNWPKIAKINKIYATGNNDWVELINETDYDFDLAAVGYRLERAKTAVDPSLIMRIGDEDDGTYPGGTVIKAHDTYLIVNHDADSYYLSQADAIATRDEFHWTASGYTIYLGVGAISSNVDTDIVDAVGFGADATYFQGDAPAAEISDGHILNRISNLGNNRLDFNLIISDDPSVAAATEQSATTTVATTTEQSATTTEETATTTNATTSDEEIATSTSETATSTSEIATSSEETATSTVASDLSPQIYLNKIYATGNNEWIELINYSDQDFDLSAANYRLEKTKTAITPSLIMRVGDPADGTYPGGTIIAGHGKYLIVRDQADDYYKSQADAIATRDEFTWKGSGYTFYLGNGPISSNSDDNIRDLVGYGPDATYWQGSRPALEITDNYILNRVATSRNNFSDFNLIPSDDPSIINPNPKDDLDLFVPPTPITSSGLTNVWHFDECYGAGSWTVGRWDCARQFGANYDPASFSLSPVANLNAFSVSFYYKKTTDYPRVTLRLSSPDSDDHIALILEPGLITAEGLPDSQWRYYVDIPFDDAWHQATLVINQADDYWSIFIDGRERVRETFWARLDNNMTDLKLSGDCNPVLVDELATWNRSLTADEIASNFAAAAPYSPLSVRPSQTAAQLLHAWDFEEDTGSLAVDSVGRTTLSVAPSSWVGRKHDNYALAITSEQNISVDLDEPIVSQDLSLTLWWRNSSYPGPGRANIYLLGGSDGQTNHFALLTDYFRLGYWFNGNYGVLSEGINKHIPYDDAWHHLALVYDSYRYKLSFYVDGEEKASTSLIWMKPEVSIKGLKILTDGASSEIDDLRIYKGALSSKQINNIYANTK